MSIFLEVNSVTYKPDNRTFLNKSGKDFTLKNISFNLLKGDILGIAGESGSGKTTLAKIIAGIYKPASGTIIINKSPEWEKIRTSPIQILFQNNGEILNPFRNIIDIVTETLIIRNTTRDNIQDELSEIFSSVGFKSDLWNKKGFQLSGGEQQRAALARAVAAKPQLLILDEPFSAQDPESQLSLAELFKKINITFGISLICISHNLKILRRLCNKIIVMYKGEIAEQGDCSQIFSSPHHAYTKYLLRAENYDLVHEELKFIDPGSSQI